MATEPSIVEYCPNDSQSRFHDLGATKAWLEKGRCTYLLLKRNADGTKELAGYGWIGAKESPEIEGGQTSFSLRVGEDHQGKGLAVLFSMVMLASAQATYHFSHLWLETWASNGGAVHIYHKLGFVDVHKKTKHRPSRSGDIVPDIRIFMEHESNRDISEQS